MQRNNYFCYLITSDNLTYIGMTNNIKRRIRQHNGLIKGGARYTKKKKNWFFLFIVGTFENKSEAMKFEWQWKRSLSKISSSANLNTTKKRKQWKKIKNHGLTNRIKRLIELLLTPKWRNLNIYPNNNI